MSTRPEALPTTETITIEGRRAIVYVVPLGPANLVLARGERGGVLACGAIDPAALAGPGIPAARVRPTLGPTVAGAADLLAGVVREANQRACALGVEPGMSGRDALARM